MSPGSRPRRKVKPTQRQRDAVAAGLVRPARVTRATAAKATKKAKSAKSASVTGGRTLRPRQAKKSKSGGQKQSGSPSHPSQKVTLTLAEVRARKSLANIYYEIDIYATRPTNQDFTPGEKKASQTEADAIHSVLRQARMIRSLDQISAARQGLVVSWLHAYKTGHKKAAAAVALGNADWALDQAFQSRFREFFGPPHPNLSTLSICAHSKTFREALFRSDDDSAKKGLPVWRDLLALIKNNTSSLELFAEVRALPWEAVLDQANEHFALLLKHVFTGAHSMTNNATPKSQSITSEKNFGIKPDDERVVHIIDDDKRDQGLWELRSDQIRKATRSNINIMVTPRTLDEFQAIFKQKYPNLQPGDEIAIDQETIKESVVLEGYEEYYPDWIKSEKGQQAIEPRFTNSVCEVCNTPSSLKAGRERTRVCTCDFVDLRDSRGLGNMLFELVEAGCLGTGVRALQHISKDTPLAEYVGEIYPTTDEETYANGDPSRYNVSRYLYSAQIPDDADPPHDPEHYNVDAIRFGNWTRYINHSCKPNTEFCGFNLGHLQYIAVKAIRGIKFGEHLTVDYGSRYWDSSDYGCRCGMSCCRNWVQEERGPGAKRPLKLGDAKSQGKAPKWAMDDDNVPYDKPIAQADLSEEAKAAAEDADDLDPPFVLDTPDPGDMGPRPRASKRKNTDNGPRRSKRQRR